MIKSKFLAANLASYASKSIIPENMVGTISDDRSAIVGKANWCFIYEGSNDYRHSYNNESLMTLARDWTRIFEARQHVCNELGSQFLQVVIPNKLTLIPEYFPETLKVDVSFALKGILDAAIDANLLVPISEFRANSVREAIFRRNDSHLTMAGNAYLAELILNNLGLTNIDFIPVETQSVNHLGDLGGKFAQSISEEFHAPLFTGGLLNQQSVRKVLDKTSAGLNGIEQVFVNPIAPIKKKIMVVGNSFFERVPSWGLSPFFSSLFMDYHFLWSPCFDVGAIKEYAPDIVVAQTCERFLTRTPDDIS